MCGESRMPIAVGLSVMGPSPRVRGIHPDDGRHPESYGSIPACAGNPPTTSRPCCSAQVHPRVCGESECTPVEAIDETGPSPRVRGIPSVSM